MQGKRQKVLIPEVCKKKQKNNGGNFTHRHQEEWFVWNIYLSCNLINIFVAYYYHFFGSEHYVLHNRDTHRRLETTKITNSSVCTEKEIPIYHTLLCNWSSNSSMNKLQLTEDIVSCEVNDKNVSQKMCATHSRKK